MRGATVSEKIFIAWGNLPRAEKRPVWVNGGTKPLSPGTGVSKGPEASLQRKAVRPMRIQVHPGDPHAQRHTGCQVGMYLLSEYARPVENTRSVSPLFHVRDKGERKVSDLKKGKKPKP